MNPRLFLDTNILLDILLERPGYQSALEILQAGSDGKVSLHTSILSMANIAYVLRKTLNQNILIPTLKIKTPSRTSLRYGESLTLHAETTNLPAGFFDLVLPEPVSPETEDVYALTLAFNDGTVPRAGLHDPAGKGRHRNHHA